MSRGFPVVLTFPIRDISRYFSIPSRSPHTDTLQFYQGRGEGRKVGEWRWRSAHEYFFQRFCAGSTRRRARLLGRGKSSGKKTRQRRGSGCRGGRDAVGVAAKCRGADQYGGGGGSGSGEGGCGRGRRGTLGRQGGTGRAGMPRFCRVSVTLSLLLSADRISSSLLSCLPAPMIVLSSFNGPFPGLTRDARR